MRALERRDARHVDVVADEHDLAGGHRVDHRPARVREDHRRASRGGRGAHRVRDRTHIPALVEVVPADEGEHASLADREREHPAGVTLRGGRGEAGEVGHAQVTSRGRESLERCSPARAEDHGDIVRPERRGGGRSVVDAVRAQ